MAKIKESELNRDEELEKIKRKQDVAPGYCPNCGAYVGAFYRCNVCHHVMPHGRRLRITQLITIFAVIFGLVGLSFYSIYHPVPIVSIGNIGPTYSNGTVRIRGNITNIDYREASDLSWKMIIFTVQDDTGSIDVKAYTQTVEEMINNYNTPAMGDYCEVKGSVYIRGNDLHLLLDSSSYFKPIRKIDFEMNATTFIAQYESNSSVFINKRIKLNGTVTKIGSDYNYIDINDKVRIYIPEYIRIFSPNITLTTIPGDTIEVTGVIQDYYGTPEILPATLNDIKIITYGGV
ncbi:MAG: OB-fold nucleic acid binding domain-containing protein [Promethearchaeota archaeon]